MKFISTEFFYQLFKFSCDLNQAKNHAKSINQYLTDNCSYFKSDEEQNDELKQETFKTQQPIKFFKRTGDSDDSIRSISTLHFVTLNELEKSPVGEDAKLD